MELGRARTARALKKARVFKIVMLPSIVQSFFKAMNMDNMICCQIDYLSFWILTLGLSSIVYKYFGHPTTQLREKYS